MVSGASSLKRETLVKATRLKRWMGAALVILLLSLACQAASPTPTPPPASDLPQENQAYIRLMEYALRYTQGSTGPKLPELYPLGATRGHTLEYTRSRRWPDGGGYHTKCCLGSRDH